MKRLETVVPRTPSQVSADNPLRDMHPVVIARSPTANTEAAISKMQQLGVRCDVKMETVFPTKADGDTTFRQRATSLTVNLDASADLRSALAVMVEALYPAPTELIEEWLAALAVKTARRKASELGAELALSVYTAHLREYPADAVRQVLGDYRGQWFPTWGELADRLDEIVEPRVMVRDRLMDLIDGGKRYTEKALPHDPVAERLALLRSQLEAADRVASKYPDLADSTDRKREAIADEISKLQGLGN